MENVNTNTKNTQDKVVLILSGGLDSTVLAYYLVSKGCEIRAVSFDYGQKHKKELQYAAETCLSLNIPHNIIDISTITSYINNSALTGTGEIPEGHYEDESMKSTVVPFRNGIMLSIAIGYAENINYESVAIANHAGDHAIYPDCRPEFIVGINTAAIAGTYNKIKLIAPFMTINKAGIARIGMELGVDFDKTWSCYKGNDVQCGVCGTCVERNEAIKEALNDKFKVV